MRDQAVILFMTFVILVMFVIGVWAWVHTQQKGSFCETQTAGSTTSVQQHPE